MTEFNPITTQEEFDNILKSRLERNTKSVTEEVSKKYEGFISPDDFKAKTSDYAKQINELTAKISEKDSSIADLTAKNKAYETNSVKMRIAHENNIPLELAGKLSGTTEDEIKADAEIFAKFIGNRQPAPLGSTEPPAVNAENAAYKKLVSKLHD